MYYPVYFENIKYVSIKIVQLSNVWQWIFRKDETNINAFSFI